MSIAVRTLGHRTFGFVRRQSRNFKAMLVRRPLHGVATNLSGQYNSIYATALGANPVQLGSLRSAGSAIGAIISLPVGWLIDTHSLKKVFLLEFGSTRNFLKLGLPWEGPSVIMQLKRWG